MSPENTSSTQGKVIDAISSFLASPPAGTPVEVIEAFDVPGATELLPPKLFLEAVEQAPVAISITDPKARVLYANKAFVKLTGYEKEEIVGKNESLLSSKSTPDAVYEAMWKTIQGKKVWKGNLVNHRKNGGEYLAKLVIAPVLNPQGKLAYFLGMHWDVSELHRLEQQLRFQKRLTEAALDAAPMVVAMVDVDRKVLLDNHAYKALLGDFRGQEPADLFIDALQQQVGIDLDGVCKKGQVFTNIDLRLDPPGGAQARWFSCSGVGVPELNEAAQSYFEQTEKKRTCLLLIANEITASRNRIIEARLNMIRATMAEQQMIQSLRESLSASIFKLQAPLNILKAVMAVPNASAEQSGLTGVLREVLDSGDEAIESLHAALPSPNSEVTSRININELLYEVLKLSTDDFLASGVVVDWRPAAVLPAITGRANALRGLFKYLIDNSIHAVSEADGEYREIRIGTGLENQELVVEVIDNGTGISEARRLKVFEPFFCGWEQSKGHAGMGLTMAQEVVISHGGCIEIDAHFLGGCRIFVRLPVHQSDGQT